MNTKLTLKLNKKAIERAKRYAKKHNQSLSVLVEDYFNLISGKEKSSDIEITPNVMELSGIIDSDKKLISKQNMVSILKRNMARNECFY